MVNFVPSPTRMSTVPPVVMEIATNVRQMSQYVTITLQVSCFHTTPDLWHLGLGDGLKLSFSFFEKYNY